MEMHQTFSTSAHLPPQNISSHSSRSSTPAANALPKDVLEASLFAPLGRSGSLTLKTIGKNYLTDAYNSRLRLLAVPNGPEVHIYNFDPDHPSSHSGCVLRPSHLDRGNALHACWGSEQAAPNLLAVAWPSKLVIYHLDNNKNGNNGSCYASKMGEIPLNRKPSGLAWHPSARIPLLAIYDVTEVTFVQCPRDKDQGEEVIFSSFQPSLPGALECISWSQWGKYLSVCMAGMLRIYNWPSHTSLDDIDVEALRPCDTMLKRRVRAIRQAGATSFVATTDSVHSMLDSMSSPSSSSSQTSNYFSSLGGGGARRGPIRPGTGASLHLIHVPDVDPGIDPSTRLVDIETGQITHIAMPDLLAVRAFGGPLGGSDSYALAAVGSHTSDTITVYRIQCHSPTNPSLSTSSSRQPLATPQTITGIFSIILPPSTRPKGIAFIGSRLVLLAGSRNGDAGVSSSDGYNWAEFNLHVAVYNLPATVYNASWCASTPVRYPGASSSSIPNSPAHSIHHRSGEDDANSIRSNNTGRGGRRPPSPHRTYFGTGGPSFPPPPTPPPMDHHNTSSSSRPTTRQSGPPPSPSPSLGSALDLRPSGYQQSFSSSSRFCNKGSPIRADRMAASTLSLSGYLNESGSGGAGGGGPGLASSGSSTYSPYRGLPSPSGTLSISGAPAERPPSAGRLTGLGKGKSLTRGLSRSQSALSNTLNILPSANNSVATPRTCASSQWGGGTPPMTPSSVHGHGWGDDVGGFVNETTNSSSRHGSATRRSDSPARGGEVGHVPPPSPASYSPFYHTSNEGLAQTSAAHAFFAPPAFVPEPQHQHGNDNNFQLHSPPKQRQQQQQQPMYQAKHAATAPSSSSSLSPKRTTPSSPVYVLERVLSTVTGLSVKVDTGFHRVETAIHDHGKRLGTLEDAVFYHQSSSSNSLRGTPPPPPPPPPSHPSSSEKSFSSNRGSVTGPL